VTSLDLAHVGGFLATGLAEVTDDLAALDRPGFWVVVVTFEGEVTCARFADVRSDSLPDAEWRGPDPTAWSSSLGEAGYVAGVARIRDRIAAGEVYQVNLCRTLWVPCGEPALGGLAARLAARHPSRYAALICLPSLGLHVCSASPELFLGRRGDVVETRPIKGTGRSASDLSVKDHAENVMIVDMARNDLGQVASTGSVRVTGLCEVEDYPGLVQLVSTVRATVPRDTGW
jgi:para-aminobenzoate synthetase component 1